MKKIIIPCLAATLLFTSAGMAEGKEDKKHDQHKKQADCQYVVKSEGEYKHKGLHNALSHVKNPVAREAIKRNIEKQEWKYQEKEHKKNDKQKDKKKSCDDAKLTNQHFLEKVLIGGVNVLELEGITTKEGAILEVDSLKDFKGIEWTLAQYKDKNKEKNKDKEKNKEATVTVQVKEGNGFVTIHPDKWKDFSWMNGDIVRLEVTNGKRTEVYIVQLILKQ